MRFNPIYSLLIAQLCVLTAITQGTAEKDQTVWLPPKDGAAFYADFLGEEDSFSKGREYHHSRKHVNFYVGDAKIKLRLWVTSEEEHLGIVTTQCSSSMCMVPDRWNYFDSSKVEGNQFSSNF